MASNGSTSAGRAPAGAARAARATWSRGAETADRVLSAALDVYARQGFDGFSVTAVIAESGVSSGSVYHHFGSLDGLCAALYARCMARLLDRIAVTLDGATTARAGIEALVRAYLRFVQDDRAAAHFIHASSYARFLTAPALPGGKGGAAELVGAAKNPRMERIVGWFRPWVEAGEIIDLPEWLIEILVIGPVAEISRRRLAGDLAQDLDLAARVLPERIWQSIHAPLPSPP